MNSPIEVRNGDFDGNMMEVKFPKANSYHMKSQVKQLTRMR